MVCFLLVFFHSSLKTDRSGLALPSRQSLGCHIHLLNRELSYCFPRKTLKSVLNQHHLITSCTSLSPLAHHCHLLHITVTSCTSLSPLAHHCHLLHITVTFCTSLSPLAHHCHLLHITVTSCTSLSPLAHHCHITRLLPLVSYHFTSGPWKTLWVQLGYDPRMHPEAKHYQCLDYRVPKEVDIIEAQNHWRLGIRRSKPSKGSSKVVKEWFCVKAGQWIRS